MYWMLDIHNINNILFACGFIFMDTPTLKVIKNIVFKRILVLPVAFLLDCAILLYPCFLGFLKSAPCRRSIFFMYILFSKKLSACFQILVYWQMGMIPLNNCLLEFPTWSTCFSPIFFGQTGWSWRYFRRAHSKRSLLLDAPRRHRLRTTGIWMQFLFWPWCRNGCCFSCCINCI